MLIFLIDQQMQRDLLFITLFMSTLRTNRVFILLLAGFREGGDREGVANGQAAERVQDFPGTARSAVEHFASRHEILFEFGQKSTFVLSLFYPTNSSAIRFRIIS